MMKQIILEKQRPQLVVPIVETNLTDTLAVITQVEHSCADMIELRVDYWERLSDLTLSTFQLINEATSLPIIVTWRTKTEGGRCQFNKSEYEKIYTNAISAGISIVDIEFRLFPELRQLIGFAHRNGTEVIGSFHDFNETPVELKQIMTEIDHSLADIVKVAVMPQEKSDVKLLLESTRDLVKPAISISMGELGAISRYEGFKYGSKFTFGTLGKSSAPGQPTIEELNNYYSHY